MCECVYLCIYVCVCVCSVGLTWKFFHSEQRCECSKSSSSALSSIKKHATAHKSLAHTHKYIHSERASERERKGASKTVCMKFICHRVCSGKAYDVNPLNAANACETFTSVTNCVSECVRVGVCVYVVHCYMYAAPSCMQRFFRSVVSDKRKRSIIVSYQIRLPAASEVSRAGRERARQRDR